MADDRRASEALSSPPEPIGGEAALALREAIDIAVGLHRDHYSEVTHWKPLNYLRGVLSQIDNMVTGWEARPAYPPDTQPPSLPEGEAVRVAISALEPFARVSTSDASDNYKPLSGVQHFYGYNEMRDITVADLRRAAAALTALTALRRSGEGV